VGSEPATGGAGGIDGRLAVLSRSKGVDFAVTGGAMGGMEGLGAVTSSSNARGAVGTTGGGVAAGAGGGSRTARGGAVAGAVGGDEGVRARSPRVTGKMPEQTLQRARTPAAGTFAGSTRYTVVQEGQVTFMRPPQRGSPGRRFPGSSDSDCWRRSITKTDPGRVLA
jgi:hypothetical protein